MLSVIIQGPFGDGKNHFKPLHATLSHIKPLKTRNQNLLCQKGGLQLFCHPQEGPWIRKLEKAMAVSGICSGVPKENSRNIAGKLREYFSSQSRNLECRKWGCNKWEFKGCLTSRPGNSEIALFLPFQSWLEIFSIPIEIFKHDRKCQSWSFCFRGPAD